jgi:flavorubredoxin
VPHRRATDDRVPRPHPYVNQWDSMMVHEERTGALFPNDLFASPVDGHVIDTDRAAMRSGVLHAMMRG